MNIKDKLEDLAITPDNCVVIGSGVLNALNLRESKDIDVVVTEEKYKELCSNPRFRKEENHGREILTDDLFEIGTSWTVVGKTWKFEDLLSNSIIVNEVRYNKVEFLLEAKQKWLADGDIRQKDVDDVKLMEDYLKNNQTEYSISIRINFPEAQ